MNGGLCALRAQGLFFIVVWAACAAGWRSEGMRGERFKRIKPGLFFERAVLCPAGTGRILFFNLGRLRGGRQMGAC